MLDRRSIAILGIESVRHKTLTQTRWLAERGFSVYVLTNHRQSYSVVSDPSAAIHQLESSPWARVRQVWRFLRLNRRTLNHVEIYPAGRFAAVYALMSRWFKIPILVVERGALLQYQKRTYDWSTRFSMRLCYQLADRIWCRAPYMQSAFDEWGLGQKTFLLPNAVPVPDQEPGPLQGRDIDLLWANRLIPEYHPEWLVDLLRDLSKERSLRCEILGFSVGGVSTGTDPRLEDRVRVKLSRIPGVHCRDYTDPRPYYERARFFLLPSEVVFANFGLLEAMSYGVVPIVTFDGASDQIVQDGVNGVLTSLDREGWLDGVKRAVNFDESAWQQLSRAARSTIEHQFSTDVWGRRLLEEYKTLASSDG